MPFLSHQGSWLYSLLPWRWEKHSVESVKVGCTIFAQQPRTLKYLSAGLRDHALILVALLPEKHAGVWQPRVVAGLQVGPAAGDAAPAAEGAVVLASPRLINQQRPSTAPARPSSDGEPLSEGCCILCLLIPASTRLPIGAASVRLCRTMQSSSGQAASAAADQVCAA